MRVIKLHSIKIRVKADTKCQPRNLRGKTCREREKKKAFQEEQIVSIVTKHNVLLVIRIQKKKKKFSLEKMVYEFTYHKS